MSHHNLTRSQINTEWAQRADIAILPLIFQRGDKMQALFRTPENQASLFIKYPQGISSMDFQFTEHCVA
ncbi:hypothetical protein AM363_24735 [Citrobacter freundii]|uniref:Uncharacterized protein n=1 Tax=Citrobacter freundii TaxID=546 RepID=A0AB33HAN5_CITFR|nr:hypothetical protein AM363_24735 [Citrobacter freundii]